VNHESEFHCPAFRPVASVVLATDLRIFPTFTEVRQPTSQELTFPAAQWRWIQPGSFSLVGALSTAISLQPAELGRKKAGA